MQEILRTSAIWGALGRTVAIVYYQRRTRELDRLGQLKRALDENAPKLSTAAFSRIGIR